MRPIHHEKIEAECLAERERDGGVGAFDVIETRDGFTVYEGSDVRATCDTLAEAIAEAQAEADDFDRRRRANGWQDPDKVAELQALALECIEKLNALHCAAVDIGAGEVGRAADQAGRLIDRFVAYKEGAPGEGEPLPWSAAL